MSYITEFKRFLINTICGQESVSSAYGDIYDQIDYDKLLNHECKGIDISTCDSNELLFYTK